MSRTKPAADMSAARNLFIVVAAPGWFRDATPVVSAHATLDAALRAAPPGHHLVVRECGSKQAGDTYFADTDALYPVVSR